MSDSKEKASKPHIKVYFETKEEVEEVIAFAKTKGFSASALFRTWVLGQMRKKGRGKK